MLIDTYFSSDENGISKLQTMIANHEIDVIVATPKTYKELSGYGYLTNLNSSLTESQRMTLSSDNYTYIGRNRRLKVAINGPCTTRPE